MKQTDDQSHSDVQPIRHRAMILQY